MTRSETLRSMVSRIKDTWKHLNMSQTGTGERERERLLASRSGECMKTNKQQACAYTSFHWSLTMGRSALIPAALSLLDKAGCYPVDHISASFFVLAL